MNKKIFGLIVVFIVVITLIGIASAFAFNESKKFFSHNGDLKEELNAAIENEDYDAWVKIIEENSFPQKGRLLATITEENFSQLVALHTAISNNDFETAKQIKKELGIKHHRKRFFGNHKKFGGYNKRGQCNNNKIKKYGFSSL